MNVVFNHDQGDYLESLPIKSDKWAIDNTSLAFKGLTPSENKTTCFSSVYSQLFSFQGANEKCQLVRDLICKDKCKEDDIKKAPSLTLTIRKFDYKFYGPEYLYWSDKEQAIHCRFQELLSLENCAGADIIVGKSFYNKYTPVFKFLKNVDNEENDGMYQSELAFLPYFDNYKPSQGVKIAIIVVAVLIVVVLVGIFIINRMKKTTNDDYHEVNA